MSDKYYSFTINCSSPSVRFNRSYYFMFKCSLDNNAEFDFHHWFNDFHKSIIAFTDNHDDSIVEFIYTDQDDSTVEFDSFD